MVGKSGGFDQQLAEWGKGLMCCCAYAQPGNQAATALAHSKIGADGGLNHFGQASAFHHHILVADCM